MARPLVRVRCRFRKFLRRCCLLSYQHRLTAACWKPGPGQYRNPAPPGHSPSRQVSEPTCRTRKLRLQTEQMSVACGSGESGARERLVSLPGMHRAAGSFAPTHTAQIAQAQIRGKYVGGKRLMPRILVEQLQMRPMTPGAGPGGSNN